MRTIIVVKTMRTVMVTRTIMATRTMRTILNIRIIRTMNHPRDVSITQCIIELNSMRCAPISPGKERS